MPRILFGVTVPVTALAFHTDQMRETLSTLGWEVHLATSPCDGFTELRQMEGFCIHELPMRRPPSLLSDIRSLARWIRLTQELDPDVVVASTPKAGLIGVLAARLCKVPVRIYHLRGLRSEGLGGQRARLSRWSERVAASCATEVLCDSASLLCKARDVRALPSSKGVVLGHGSCCGVDIDYFRPPTYEERQAARRNLGIDEDDIVIGFVGRLVADKGIHELISSFRALQQKQGNLVLALVGAHEDAGIDVSRLEPSIRVLGPTREIRGAYWAFDIFCLPSYREGFPISSLEAQACGLPIVTTSATGCVDSLPPQAFPFMVPVGNEGALATALSTLIRDTYQRHALGGLARSWVSARFRRQTVTSLFVHFVRSQLDGRTPAQRRRHH